MIVVNAVIWEGIAIFFSSGPDLTDAGREVTICVVWVTGNVVK